MQGLELQAKVIELVRVVEQNVLDKLGCLYPSQVSLVDVIHKDGLQYLAELFHGDNIRLWEKVSVGAPEDLRYWTEFQNLPDNTLLTLPTYEGKHLPDISINVANDWHIGTSVKLDRFLVLVLAVLDQARQDVKEVVVEKLMVESLEWFRSVFFSLIENNPELLHNDFKVGNPDDIKARPIANNRLEANDLGVI
ncbi:hypothetical protein HG530_013380 [Fusarium avenaceum]|nr:hypothetical protein HG530_013380 [Fusarium avenaceum]